MAELTPILLVPADALTGLNLALVRTLVPLTGTRVFIEAVDAGYKATPTNGGLIITSARGTLRQWPLSQAGPAPLGPRSGWIGIPGESITITLAAGGSGVDGYLNVDWRSVT